MSLIIPSLPVPRNKARRGANGIPVTKEQIARAVALIEDSRRTHVEWAEYMGTDQPTDQERKTAGDVAWHIQCIAEYDEVLAVLDAVQRHLWGKGGAA